MGRHFDSQDGMRQVGEVEKERTTSNEGDGHRRLYDAADGIDELAGHEHQNHDHQRLGHVVLRLRLLGHDLTTKVELTQSFDEAVGHGGAS